MAWFKRSSRLRSRFRLLTILLVVTFTVGLVINLPVQVQAQLRPSSLTSRLSDQIPGQWGFRAPRGPGAPAPVNTLSGGTRGNGCKPGEKPPVSLVPFTSVNGAMLKKGTTIAEYPTFFWHMPETSASAAEFVISDTKGDDVYRAQYALAQSGQAGLGTPGIMSITLPAYANLSPLNVGEEYYWTLALICNPLDRSGDVRAEGWIERVQPDPSLVNRLQQATPQERVGLYANAQLWHETLTTLNELRRDSPNSTDFAAAWDKLLTAAGLDLIAQK